MKMEENKIKNKIRKNTNINNVESKEKNKEHKIYKKKERSESQNTNLKQINKNIEITIFDINKENSFEYYFLEDDIYTKLKN
jgi:hypothetical protein